MTIHITASALQLVKHSNDFWDPIYFKPVLPQPEGCMSPEQTSPPISQTPLNTQRGCLKAMTPGQTLIKINVIESTYSAHVTRKAAEVNAN
jgi:hypothetical protein